MIFSSFSSKTGFMNPCIAAKKNGHDPLGCVRMAFLSGVRCAPAFFERCGRFAKNCVCSRLHSPQRLTRLCGCCDEPHFCFCKNGFHESLYHSQKKRTRPVRVCPYDFLSGVRCAPAFFERCGRFTKNCVCSRLHSPQRLTLLCGCCDEPHFCFRKNGFHESLYRNKKRTRPVRVCPYIFVQGYGAFRKTSTADAVARSFLLTPDFAVGKSSFFRRFDEPHFCFRKNGFHESLYHSQKKRTRPARVCPFLAAIQGFEPRQAESEAAVLPLHYIAIPRLYIKPLYYTTFRKFVKGDKC